MIIAIKRNLLDKNTTTRLKTIHEVFCLNWVLSND